MSITCSYYMYISRLHETLDCLDKLAFQLTMICFIMTKWLKLKDLQFPDSYNKPVKVSHMYDFVLQDI